MKTIHALRNRLGQWLRLVPRHLPRWAHDCASVRAPLLLAALLLAGAPGLHAQAARVPLFADVQHAMSLDEAADRVRDAYGGQVIAASPARTGGREGYRIRVILDDGRVITVFVDAESGAMRQMG